MWFFNNPPNLKRNAAATSRASAPTQDPAELAIGGCFEACGTTIRRFARKPPPTPVINDIALGQGMTVAIRLNVLGGLTELASGVALKPIIEDLGDKHTHDQRNARARSN